MLECEIDHQVDISPVLGSRFESERCWAENQEQVFEEHFGEVRQVAHSEEVLAAELEDPLSRIPVEDPEVDSVISVEQGLEHTAVMMHTDLEVVRFDVEVGRLVGEKAAS